MSTQLTGGARSTRIAKPDLSRFRTLLERQRADLLDDARKVVAGEVHLDPDDFPDEIDMAATEVGLSLVGRLRERQRGLLGKIAAALSRLDAGTYGECEECGEQIGIRRLEARPVAELCIDCKSQQERLERRESIQ
jgi:DnaK suppressor protein